MLSTRSARLAACLLLALLLGWVVRSYRQQQAAPVSARKTAPQRLIEKSVKNSFPEE